MKLKRIRKEIEESWGRQCPDFSIDCCVCQVHLALAILEQKYDVAIGIQLWKKARPHPKKK